jgi:S1-C subfamily serine protease
MAAATLAVRRLHRAAMLGVGSGAIVSILVGAMLLVNTGTNHPAPTVEDMPPVTAAVTRCCTLQPSATRAAEEAIVSVAAAAGSDRSTGCGVVVGQGLVATTTSALRGRRSVRVVVATGHQFEASVVATDRLTGIALLRLSALLPAAPTPPTPLPDVGSGMGAMVVAMTPKAHGAPRTKWASGVVVSVGSPPAGEVGMADITVRGSSVPSMPGEPLIDPQGRVVGILSTSRGAERAFLPISLVVGVSDELEMMGRVRHGWLGLRDDTAQGTSGAQVLAVDPHGASARMLRPGDVIVAVDGSPVTSAAELRSIIYVLAPGTRVTVEAVRGDQVVDAVVELGASP